ncbi:unnamed protein product [Adineta steineri]|uniref:G-protein coupled receptors family 1 profile domain-containing protein n=1 Tax=Adineta steineri TaxID=433720 RepID=A0A820CPT1_9BILA|nr:unnamed protein product [Adineta steineri]
MHIRIYLLWFQYQRSKSLLFLLTMIPLGLWNTMGPRFLTFVTLEQLHTYISILYFIQSINYSINFYVYVCSSKLVREKLLRILHFNFGQHVNPIAQVDSIATARLDKQIMTSQLNQLKN